ncbi:MAG: Na+:solute symporter, partial [Bacteroidota bacterium]
ASMVAAYMSTISTHLNWGASYLVNDVYKEFIDKEASEKKLVAVGRICTVILMVVSTLIAMALTNSVQLFKYILMFGAGTGLIFILRWFWWRINAWSEISAMFASGLISITVSIPYINSFLFDMDEGLFPNWFEFPFVVILSTIIWLTVTFLTKPDDDQKLFDFYKRIQPGGKGWKRVIDLAKQKNISIVTDTGKWMVPQGLLAMILGCLLVYCILFTTGMFIYGNTGVAWIMLGVAVVLGFLLFKVWKLIGGKILA